MPQEMPDSDWELLRQVSAEAYDRYCIEALQEAKGVLDAERATATEKFESLLNLMKEKGKELNTIFNTFNYSRSNAITILDTLCNWNLVSANDLKKFTESTQSRIRRKD